MSEGSGEVPNTFKPPDTKVASSIGKDVFGYRNEGQVLKVIKEGARESYPSWLEAANIIEENTKTKEIIREILTELGSNKDIVSETQAVIHATPSSDQKITYSEVQTWYKGSKTLSSLKFKFFDLPEDSLNEIKSIFATDIKLWKKYHTFLDIVGSRLPTPPKITILYYFLFPLMNAENVLITPDNHTKFIDVEKSESSSPFIKSGVRGFFLSRLKLLGDYISIGLIDLALLSKRFSLRKQKTSAAAS